GRRARRLDLDRRQADGAGHGGGDPDLLAAVAIRIVRLGSTRGRGEGLRVGTVRRPPRGVARADLAQRDYYDVWLPELAPAAATVAWALSAPWTDSRWRRFARL